MSASPVSPDRHDAKQSNIQNIDIVGEISLTTNMQKLFSDMYFAIARCSNSYRRAKCDHLGCARFPFCYVGLCSAFGSGGFTQLDPLLKQNSVILPRRLTGHEPGIHIQQAPDEPVPLPEYSRHQHPINIFHVDYVLLRCSASLTQEKCQISKTSDTQNTGWVNFESLPIGLRASENDATELSS